MYGMEVLQVITMFMLTLCCFCYICSCIIRAFSKILRLCLSDIRDIELSDNDIYKKTDRSGAFLQIFQTCFVILSPFIVWCCSSLLL